jgi:hypothetical protein
MKPIPQIIPPGHSRSDHPSLQRKHRSLLFDYHFQPTIGGNSSNADSPKRVSPSAARPSIRDISRDFIEGETPEAFCAELSLFGVIALISAWPFFALVEAWTALPK